VSAISIIKKLFRGTPTPKESIEHSLYKLETQRKRLESFLHRVQQRDRTLFSQCSSASSRGDREKATMLATELSELRKLEKTCLHGELVLERLILRLETIKACGDVFFHLRPTLTVVRGVSDILQGAMPDIAAELGRIGEGLSDQISTFNTTVPDVQFPINAAMPNDILSEVQAIVEQQLQEKLPAIPAITPSIIPVQPRLVEVAADGGSEDEGETLEPAGEMALIRPGRREAASLEDKLLRYVQRTGGRVDLAECARELGASHEQVLKTLDTLTTNGKVVVK
jgi:division protein CdvB (Snf7/Vps24/ESCRT-III family)